MCDRIAMRTAGLIACAVLWLLVGPARAQVVPPVKPPGLEESGPTVPKVDIPDDADEDEAERKRKPKQRKKQRKKEHQELEPFGANLFRGNFLGAREESLNPDYVILPGDHVAVHTWGTVDVNRTFTVDSQGNIFLPEVGPIRVAGVRNAALTETVRAGMQRVFTKGFNVYTNLITASPVAVFVTGGVEQPGRYGGIPSDSPLFFLDQAGGIDPDLGSYRAIRVLREGKAVAEIDLYEFILEGHMPDMQFADGDTILVEQRGPVIELRGDVAKPTLLELEKSPMKGRDALEVVPGSARATQVTLQGLRDGLPSSSTMSLEDFSSTPIRDGDAVYLRADGLSETILIHIEGEYKGASTLAVRRGSHLVDVLNYIPVNPALADVDAVHVRRKSVAQAQKKSIDDALFRLERSALLALSESNGESNIRVKEAELTLEFVERARTIQPLGRVVTARDGVQQNLLLEDGDVIVIPPKTNVVRVSGEVMMAQAVVHADGATAETYIEDAGGYTERADDDRVIVIKPNAEVRIGDEDTPVGPGDEVLVPPEVDTKYLQNVSDVTTVIYQVAVSAAVVLTFAL